MLWWSTVAFGQIGPENDGFVEYDLLGTSSTIGRIVVTGTQASGALPANRAAWVWFAPTASLPDQFRLVAQTSGSGVVADGWTFAAGSFPVTADTIPSLSGFTCHEIRRAPASAPIGHLWSRGSGSAREQIWTTTEGELDASRLLRDRSMLWFQRVEVLPSAGPARKVSTLNSSS